MTTIKSDATGFEIEIVSVKPEELTVCYEDIVIPINVSTAVATYGSVAEAIKALGYKVVTNG
jgi:hypothetical protein